MAQQTLVGQGCLFIEVSRSQTQQAWQDSPGRVIGPTQRPVPDNTQHSQKTNIHDSGGFRTRNSSKRVAADPQLRLRGNWDRHHRD